MSVSLQDFGWAALTVGVAAAWLVNAITSSILAFVLFVRRDLPPESLAAWLAVHLDPKWPAALAAAGFLIVLVTWRAGRDRAPAALRRLLPSRVPTPTTRGFALACALCIAWGWGTVWIGKLLAGIHDSTALLVFLILHLPLGFLTGPVRLLLAFVHGQGLPGPAAATFTVLWLIGGIVLHLGIESYRRPWMLRVP